MLDLIIVVVTILTFAAFVGFTEGCERQITQLVLGQPARSRWEELLRGSTINRVLRMSRDIDIHLVPRWRGMKMSSEEAPGMP